MLEYVVAVAEERSFSKAAKRLYISQPSLSQGIIALERQIGMPLFDRSTVPLSLTYAGEKYVEYAVKMLNLQHEMEMGMGDVRGDHTGRLIVGISLFRNTTILSHVFPVFHKVYPNVKLIVREAINESIIEMAASGQLDVGFINRFPPSDHTCIELLTDRVMLAVGREHPICARYDFEKEPYPRIDLNVFRDEFFALTSLNSNLRSISDDIFRDYGFIPKIAFETFSLELTHQLAVKNCMPTVILDSLLRLYPKERRARYFLFDRGDYTNSLYICHKKNKYVTHIMRDFIRITQEVVAQNAAARS
jgi:Transcriptional regulator